RGLFELRRTFLHVTLDSTNARLSAPAVICPSIRRQLPAHGRECSRSPRTPETRRRHRCRSVLPIGLLESFREFGGCELRRVAVRRYCRYACSPARSRSRSRLALPIRWRVLWSIARPPLWTQHTPER